MRIKGLFVVVLASLVTMAASAQGMKNRPSPPDTVVGVIDGAKISVAYSQPSVKGRDIWGDLVPYNKIWRAGANEATVFEISKPVTINGEKLEKGRYAFFLIPNKKGDWTAIFNTDSKQWGAYKHDAKKDALRVPVSPVSSDFVEQMKFDISEDVVSLHWEKIAIPLTISAAK